MQAHGDPVSPVRAVAAGAVGASVGFSAGCRSRRATPATARPPSRGRRPATRRPTCSSSPASSRTSSTCGSSRGWPASSSASWASAGCSNMDRRGCGLSDPRHEALSLEDEARDVLAVLDAAGSERAVLMGYTTGGPLAITTAALRARARAGARPLRLDGARRGRRRRRLDLRRGRAPRDVGAARRGVGHRRQPRAARAVARRRPADEGVDGAHGAPVLEPGRAACGSWATSATTTSAHLLGELRVPTLILHRTGDRLIDVRHSRYLAERIPARATSSSRASTTSRARSTARTCSARSRSSSPAGARAPSRASC